MRILLIEDDPLIGNGLHIGLKQLGLQTDWFTDGETGLHALAAAPYDAAVLDLTLPKMDGLEVLTRWRAAGADVPVLILTARDALDERLTGLQLGADDYLGKPFALAEVAARLQALIRRRYGQQASILTHGELQLDLQRRKVRFKGAEVSLTSKEYRLLELFMLQGAQVLTRTQIEEKLTDWDSEFSQAALEVHIYNLRKKIAKNLIRTVHGVGYALGNLDEK